MTARTDVNGILLLDKPFGVSSNSALQSVKKLFNAKKAGHTGSLDPLATGMLPICFGEATKFSQYLLNANKSYLVTGKLGQTTTTGDKEGEVIATKPVPKLSSGQVEALLQQFVGEIEQVPPMYSALKHQGKPLYLFARQGKHIDRPARTITIHSIELLELEPDSLTLAVSCSKGTYIRTLIEDIAKVIGCGAHVASLHRTRVEPFMPASVLTMEQLLESDQPALLNHLLPIDASVSFLPQVLLNDFCTENLMSGRQVEHCEITPNQEVKADVCPNNERLVRFYQEKGGFLGVGLLGGNGQVLKRRLVAHFSGKKSV